MKKFCVVVLACLFPIILLSQTENWVYRYNGPANSYSDEANAIVYGADGNIYAAGFSDNTNFDKDFFVVSLTSAGDTNWVYTYDAAAHQDDIAYSLCMVMIITST
jgi:hypothetical protein